MGLSLYCFQTNSISVVFTDLISCHYEATKVTSLRAASGRRDKVANWLYAIKQSLANTCCSNVPE